MRTKLLRILFIAASLFMLSSALADTTRVSISGNGFLKFGMPFTPRGTNYVRVSTVDPTKPMTTFTPCDIRPGDCYIHNNAVSALAGMAGSGYNVVRVFVEPHDVGYAAGSPMLNGEYLANVADFLAQAKAYNIEVILTLPYFPGNYTPYSPCAGSFGSGNMNEFILDPYFWTAKSQYVTDLVQGLRNAGAPLDIIMAYSIENEVMFYNSNHPFDNWTGTNNNSCFVESVGRQQLMDANMVQWINQVAAAVKSVHPQALVTAGFTSEAAAAQTNRSTRAYWAIFGSNLDYVSIHVYPGALDYQARPAGNWGTPWMPTNGQWQTELSSFFEGGNSAKPIVLEEFGAKIGTTETPDLTTAAYTLRDYQIFTCNSYLVHGWFTWTWDTDEATSDGTYYSTLSSGGAINGLLAPVARPNACSP